MAVMEISDLEKRISELTDRVSAIEKSAGNDRLAIGVMQGDLDSMIASFIIALGAVAYDIQVDMFFTFWAIAALRDPNKSAKKSFMDRMFGLMLPRSSRALPLSKMQMAGIGPKMIRGVMKQRGVKSLEELIKEAGELGVRIHICEMSMNVMGFKAQEMIDYPNLDYVGVGTFISLISESRQVLFF
ncbi:MAG: DsrE/DsrF/DrsH-like family protein [Planctomycetia bacterium]|jgi:peroxiredoxin family protein|nr:DsrE/DsrF/DrsH-like family protein [Planctomycetia bacterium]